MFLGGCGELGVAVAISVEDVAQQIKAAAAESISEEDLRIRVETSLRIMC